jgi:hypothetical protein
MLNVLEGSPGDVLHVYNCVAYSPFGDAVINNPFNADVSLKRKTKIVP